MRNYVSHMMVLQIDYPYLSLLISCVSYFVWALVNWIIRSYVVRLVYEYMCVYVCDKYILTDTNVLSIYQSGLNIT